MKGVSEYNIALVIAVVFLLALLAITLGWLKVMDDDTKEASRTIDASAGCASDESVCASNPQGYACVHDSMNSKNICGCRAWLGIDANPDCATGMKCESAKGTNFGLCA
ncbi:MAG: hypothetical protein V1731_01920 [Candidatus Aenigmatarchaeota archaeon]